CDSGGDMTPTFKLASSVCKPTAAPYVQSCDSDTVEKKCANSAKLPIH
ncbi:MAG: hypothetical protein ACI90R_000166, partial [Alteromonas macleodii]